MEDLFKKFIYTGIGWVSNTTDKLKKLEERVAKLETLAKKKDKKKETPKKKPANDAKKKK